MRPTWPRSPTPTTPTSAWWPAETRPWPPSGPANATSCWPPPKPTWNPSRPPADAEKRPLRGADKIGVRVGKVVNRHKMAKHFELAIDDTSLAFPRKTDQIAAEAALDGIYVVRASAPHTAGMDAAAVVGAYKDLSLVEADFRGIKTIDLDLRPIYHYSEDRVRAHVFICMLASYLIWHLRRAWAPMCFSDENKPPRPDPVAPARRSTAARTKASRQHHPDGQAIHSLATLFDELATLTRNTIVFAGGARITKLAVPTPIQRHAFELIGTPIPIELNPT